MVDAEDAAWSFARRLADGCAGALPEAVLVSAIVHGSLVLGDYLPGSSDVDLLVVVERSLAHREAAALEALVNEHAGQDADLRVVTQASVSAPVRSPALEFYAGRHRGIGLEVDLRVVGEPDLLVEFSVARDHGRSLIGLEPRQVVAPVPWAWIIEHGDRVLARWQGLTDDQANAELMALTACRIWRFAEERDFCSKTTAGQWALALDPSLVAVAQALELRAGHPKCQIDAADLAYLLAAVRRRIVVVRDAHAI